MRSAVLLKDRHYRALQFVSFAWISPHSINKCISLNKTYNDVFQGPHNTLLFDDNSPGVPIGGFPLQQAVRQARYLLLEKVPADFEVRVVLINY